MTEVAAAELARGQRVDLRCGRMVHGGVCLAQADDGAAVLVAGAIPGEVVRAVLRYRKRSTWFADAAEVLEPSPHRVAAPCPYVPECGGCQLQHIAYDHQVTLKQEILLDALRRQGVTPLSEPRVHPMSEPWRYRRRGEFHIVPGADGAAGAGLGFNRARSWRPIAVDDCIIHEKPITDSLPALRDFVRSEGATAQLATLHVTLSDERDELLVQPRPAGALPQAAVDELALHLPPRLWLSTNGTTLRWRGHTYRVTSGTFVQVNRTQMETLYGCVLGGLDVRGGRHIADAYAGVGILPVHMASLGADVTCIESNRESARTGVLNARMNDVSARVRYVLATAEEALPRLAAERPFDAVVLDPPRAGCGGTVTGWLALAGPDRVVYASCDVATLARDLHVLTVSGPYAIEALDVVDMFPQTYHLETVAVLQRAPA